MIQPRIDELRLGRARATGQKKPSLQQVAQESGIGYVTLQRLSAGDSTRVDFATLDALCRYFGCNVCDLLEYVPE
jgi:putative transcriptional regulator